MKEEKKKNKHISSYVGFMCLFYLGFIGVFYSLIVKEAHFLFILSIELMVASLLVFPNIKNKKIKNTLLWIIGGLGVFTIVFAPVTIITALKHVIKMIIVAYFILFNFIHMAVGGILVVLCLPFMVIAALIYLLSPRYPWYWW